MKRIILIGLIVVLLIALGWAYLMRPTAVAPTSEQPTATTTPTAATGTIKIALLDYANQTNGKQRGCDRVVMATRTVPTTSMPLTAALQELFAINQTSVDGYDNFIPKTKGTLSFDHATVANGTAKIYLTGSLSGLAGVCDDPRAKIQIEETALQFPSVQNVALYLNNTLTNLQPSEQ